MTEKSSRFDNVSKMVQVVSVVVGVVISVCSFNAARVREAEAREFEAAKPFYTLRQNLYADAVKAAGVLANPEVHTSEELAKAKTRFRELYVAELSMVEAPEVESKMMALAKQLDPELQTFTAAQHSAYDLAHALGDTFSFDWKVNRK